MNLGIDFGSTYSLISIYDKNSGGLSCINIDVGSPYIPSVVSFNNNTKRYDYGKAALSKIGSEDARVFTTFKTLLNPNTSKDLIAKREYDEEYTPESISYIFWEKVFTKIRRMFDNPKIENMVVGVPEIWGNKFCVSEGKKTVTSAEARKAVERIFSKFDFVDKVRIVTEPQAATAFFAYNYKKKHGKNLDGNVLIIDYGGGTLDITLSSVTNLGDGDKMQIKVIDSEGEGENSGKIGNAGILYMESLISQALRECGVDNVEYNGSFMSIRHKLEENLRTRTDEIEEIFEEYINQPQMLKKAIFMSGLNYKYSSSEKTVDFNINYNQMVEVYNDVIWPTLNRLIDKVCVSVNTNSDNFKIGLVGGFGNYYLVRKQVRDKFHIAADDDQRISGMLTNPEDREKAVSLGCSLIANNLINLCETFEFALGIYARVDNQIFYNYAIKYREEIEYNKIFFSQDKHGSKYIFRSVNGSLARLLIKMGNDDKDAFDMVPKAEYAYQLKNVITNSSRTAFVGFSVRPDNVICIHIWECDPVEKRVNGKKREIPLTDFDNMFEPTALL